MLFEQLSVAIENHRCSNGVRASLFFFWFYETLSVVFGKAENSNRPAPTTRLSRQFWANIDNADRGENAFNSYLVDGAAKVSFAKGLQPTSFLSRGDAHEKERLVVDGGQDGHAQPAAYFGPAQTVPKTVVRPAGTEEPPRHATHLHGGQQQHRYQ